MVLPDLIAIAIARYEFALWILFLGQTQTIPKYHQLLSILCYNLCDDYHQSNAKKCNTN